MHFVRRMVIGKVDATARAKFDQRKTLLNQVRNIESPVSAIETFIRRDFRVLVQVIKLLVIKF